MAGRKKLKYSAKSESSKIKKIIDAFELENPELEDLPLEYRKLYDKARRADVDAGIQPVDYQWKGNPWTTWSGGKNNSPKAIDRVHYNLQQKITKAKSSGKFIELEEYLKHPSLKDDPELAKQLFEHNNQSIARISNKSNKKIHNDHISPKSNPEYGWEVGRNKQLLGDKDNIVKGNKAPSEKLMQRLGIGKTKSEQIDLLRSSPLNPDTGTKYTPREVRQLVSEDIAVPFTKGMGDSQKALALTQTANKKYTNTKVVDRTNGNGNGNGNGKLNGKNGKNGFSRKLNGIGARKIDSALNLALAVKSGNYGGAAVTGATLTAGELLKSKSGQKAIATQIAKIAAKRGGKTALKLIPGLDVYISGREAWDYAAQGKFDQAGIAALSGAIGWIPVIGDGASAALDLSNTGIDISRGALNLENDTKPNKKRVRRTKL